METTSHNQLKSLGDRPFGLTFAGLFMAIGLYPLIADEPVRIVFIGLSAIMLTLAILRPKTLTRMNKAWMKVAGYIHIVISTLIMGFVYFVFVVPLGVLLRKKTSVFLRLKKDPARASYWKTLEPRAFDKQFFTDPF